MEGGRDCCGDRSVENVMSGDVFVRRISFDAVLGRSGDIVSARHYDMSWRRWTDCLESGLKAFMMTGGRLTFGTKVTFG